MTTRTIDVCRKATAKCHGDLWRCATCNSVFCELHSHTTEKGHNVECVSCERERKDTQLLDKPDVVAEIAKKLVDPVARLDIRDK